MFGNENAGEDKTNLLFRNENAGEDKTNKTFCLEMRMLVRTKQTFCLEMRCKAAKSIIMTFVYHNFYLLFTVNPISLCEDNQEGPLNLLVRQRWAPESTGMGDNNHWARRDKIWPRNLWVQKDKTGLRLFE